MIAALGQLSRRRLGGWGARSGREGLRGGLAGAQLVQQQRQRQQRQGRSLGAWRTVVGRSCRGRSLVPGTPRRPLRSGKGGGCPASSSPSEGRFRLLCSPEPWSRRAVCSLPWWSWATLSPWPLCGTGTGGAGGRRMSKVSPLVATARAAVTSRHPVRRLRAGRARGRLPPAPASPYALPFRPGEAALARAQRRCCPRLLPCFSGQGRGSVASSAWSPAPDRWGVGGRGSAGASSPEGRSLSSSQGQREHR